MITVRIAGVERARRQAIVRHVRHRRDRAPGAGQIAFRRLSDKRYDSKAARQAAGKIRNGKKRFRYGTIGSPGHRRDGDARPKGGRASAFRGTRGPRDESWWTSRHGKGQPAHGRGHRGGGAWRGHHNPLRLRPPQDAPNRRKGYGVPPSEGGPGGYLARRLRLHSRRGPQFRLSTTR